MFVPSSVRSKKQYWHWRFWPCVKWHWYRFSSQYFSLPLSLPSHHCSIIIFINMLPLAEGRTGLDHRILQKAMLFRKFWSAGQKSTFTFGSSVMWRRTDVAKKLTAFFVRVNVILLGLPDLEDAGSTILRNVQKQSPRYTASHFRICSAAAAFRRSQILQQLHYLVQSDTKKRELLKTPTKIEEIQKKKIIDRNWTITTRLLRDSNPDY